MDMNKTVCYCFNITNGDIKKAIEDGATTLEEVQEKTGAGTACGACLDQIDVLVNYFTKENQCHTLYYKRFQKGK